MNRFHQVHFGGNIWKYFGPFLDWNTGWTNIWKQTTWPLTHLDVKCVHQNGKCVVTHHQLINRASETFMVLSVRLSTLIVATSNALHCHSHSQTVFLPTMFNTGCSKITSITFHVLCFTWSPPSSPSPSLSSSWFMIVVIISPHKMLGAEHFLSIFVVNASFHTEKNTSLS